MYKCKKIVDISKKSFFSAVLVLLAFMVIATVLTYVLPKGKFAVDQNGTVDFSNFISFGKDGGINLLKAIFAPVLIFFSDGFLQPLMLSIFLLVIAGVFQTMMDSNGMQAIVDRLVNKFKNRKFLFVAVVTLFFMCLGAFFGLFEETLILLPLIVTVCTSLGYDAFVGFCVCSLATGIGFSVAITNPFTIVYSSQLIGASVTSGIWFRLLAFALFYGLILGFIRIYSRNKKGAELGNLVEQDVKISEESKKPFVCWAIFLIVALTSLITFTSISSLRSLAMPLLAVVFLVGGVIAGWIIFGIKNTLKSFGKGALSALPAVAMISLAFAINYILVEGMVLDTITRFIATGIAGKSKYLTTVVLFAIILILEFFISSSTAKAVLVMGVLSGVIGSGGLDISRELLVLIYIFSDGFTNMLFPTSPTLLIGLSMTGQSYISWLKKSKFLFLIVFALSIGLLMLALAIGY